MILVFTKMIYCKVFFRLGRIFGDKRCFMPLRLLEEYDRFFWEYFHMRLNTSACSLNIFQCQPKDGTLNTVCTRTSEGPKISLDFTALQENSSSPHSHYTLKKKILSTRIDKIQNPKTRLPSWMSLKGQKNFSCHCPF